MSTTKMTTAELSSKLYNARNEYCKAKAHLEYCKQQISHYSQLHKESLRGFDLFAEMFGELETI